MPIILLYLSVDWAVKVMVEDKVVLVVGELFKTNVITTSRIQ